MKNICIVFRRPPHGTPHGREALDLAMLSASFEQRVTLIFVDEGVLNLVAEQSPELIGTRNYIATFKALPFYDIDDVLVCAQSLQEFGLKRSVLNIDAEIAEPELISGRLRQADEVLVF
ncbi:MAG: sulfurtransferase complex subunit TusC [Shewanella sp.]|nr:sulfurtransferase complex subunit TusC [Shewanella sp.]MCF1430085.1 sulfurtransferase complex subunit TusC [Shewanella sp.]MCF1438299.1 sulfurtransferase complex subunit TusC [Shewanella sp.]MCF1456378.1 sulfurtransferase complex subunit TusC [Shewanella sp.]